MIISKLCTYNRKEWRKGWMNKRNFDWNIIRKYIHCSNTIFKNQKEILGRNKLTNFFRNRI
jgi:hypothetical protein